jgi:tetratricopeptide (TPR) repeat protein
MNRNHLALIVAAAVLAVPVAAQTAAELLQKGIYAQETEGKLDDAIQIYRQIVNSAPNPREVGAQAQYRLAQALLQKGDTNGAAQEFARLARDYSEYPSVISQLARQGGRGGFGLYVYSPNGIAQPLGGRGGRGSVSDPNAQADLRAQARLQELQQARVLAIQQSSPQVEFDSTKPVTLNGKLSQVEWINPNSWVKVDTAGGTYSVQLASPNTMLHAGMTRATLTPGMEVSITGILAKDGTMTALANTLSFEGKLIFDRANLPNVPAVVTFQPPAQ